MRVKKVSSTNHLRDIVAYICRNYPHKDELSNARVTKMVYLADWRSALERGKTLSGITWKFNHYGPFVYDVIEAVRKDSAFQVISTWNMYGEPKELLQVADDVTYPSLKEDEEERESRDIARNDDRAIENDGLQVEEAIALSRGGRDRGGLSRGRIR
jgi:hypothetical protein